jgi:protein-disulfide isomerase
VSEIKQLIKPIIYKKDHYKGSTEDKITVLVYGDYQCEDVKDLFISLEKIQKRIEFTYVFRNFPLINCHDQAIKASLAAEAAAAQGKFFEMHRLLLLNQDRLEDEDIMLYAKKVGLDMKLFQRDYDNMVYLGKVQKDIQSGEENGVTETPTIFINGVMYEESYDYRTLMNVVNTLNEMKVK